MKLFRHLYIHIPFCRHKCGYCDFNAYAGMDDLMPAYVDALERELESARRRYPFGSLRTVYLGGGTPSLLLPSLVQRMLARVWKLFDVDGTVEVTLEANPASTDPEKLKAWMREGVNRLSLGVQSFDPRALSVLERKTDGAQAVRAFSQAREAGFHNISLDLIFGVPSQTLASWHRSVEKAIGLGPEHLSCYCLTFEAGTLLERRRNRGQLVEPGPDQQWEFLDQADKLLASAGYGRYEVSSWGRPGKRSRHNQAYWACHPVYGAGAGAHSYAVQGNTARRWWNVARPNVYIARSPDVVEEGEELDSKRARAEQVMLGLRTMAGLRSPAGFEPELAELEDAGLVKRRGSRVIPTRRGLDLHNQIALAVL
jgi:oxygen-independent coproporphyrinogen-3 oxidase